MEEIGLIVIVSLLILGPVACVESHHLSSCATKGETKFGVVSQDKVTCEVVRK